LKNIGSGDRQMRFKMKREEIPSIVMMQIFVPELPEQSRKRQNSLFLKVWL
jgi:hypothetical protein